ncbi:hypothetical protein [Paenibacillus sp. 2TAB19]|uniref:hypothetical protein n=1 Tax=Paenibacillus sp. 2TAB19 TaxID=3233003 RepID=UPI003F9D3379
MSGWNQVEGNKAVKPTPKSVPRNVRDGERQEEERGSEEVGGLSADRILELQRTIGNQAVIAMFGARKAHSPAANRNIVRSEARNSPVTEEEELVEEQSVDESVQLTPEAVGSMGVESILAMAPPQEERTYEEKLRDVTLAKETMDKIVRENDDLSELESYFPRMTLRFGLKRIGFEDVGSPEARVTLEINPKAACFLVNGNEYTLNKGANHGMSDKQDVKFKTGTSPTGDKWGVEMTASQLGPNHPQGFGPTEQRGLMKHLPTNRANHPGLENRYIRGHLLNDSLGGPGLAQNLFPITERANKDHEMHVESKVKDWVNKLGYFVYYHVEVKNIRKSLDKTLTDDSTNYVDGDLHCEAYVLSVNGGRANTGHYVNTIIKSEHGKDNGQDAQAETTAKTGDAADKSHHAFVTKKWVELSVTKNKGEKDFDPVAEEVADGIMEFYSEVEDKLKSDTILTLIATEFDKFFKSTSPQNVKFVLQAITMETAGRSSEIEQLQIDKFSNVGKWNQIINQLSKHKDKIADSLDEMTAVVDTYNSLSDDEKAFLADVAYKCKEQLLLAKMIENYPGVENAIEEMNKEFETLGLEHARAGRRSMKKNLRYESAYGDYGAGSARAGSGADLDRADTAYRTGFEDYGAGLSDASTGALASQNYIAYTDAYKGYEAGLADAKQGKSATSDKAAYAAAYNEYAAGLKDAQASKDAQSADAAYEAAYAEYKSGLADAQQEEAAQNDAAAYRAGYDEYGSGWGDARSGQAAASTNDGYRLAMDEYSDGLSDARQGLAAQNGHAAYAGAHDDYGRGWDSAKQSQPAAKADVSYMAGYDDYKQGWQHAEQGQAAQLAYAAYAEAHAEYGNGLADAQNGQALQRNDAPYTAAYREYFNGMTDCQSDNVAQMNHHAYLEGYNEYTNGHSDAQNGLASQSANESYMTAYDEYNDGMNDAAGDMDRQHATKSYSSGYSEYTEGLVAAEFDRDPQNANAAYMAGYNSHEQNNKKQRR